jgi:SEC-C motif-containing protein
MPCPCRLTNPVAAPEYEACCGPLHQGAVAVTAEALMRSRYSAYAKRDLPYLIRTSHPLLRAKLKAKDLVTSCGLGWCGLEIVACAQGGAEDHEGMVHFRATYRGGILEERSRFVRMDGAWVYLDGRGR